MNVLVACEYSGRVRDAFIAAGHNAWSCDLLPSERPGPHHCGDVTKILDDGWDLLIAHPPCTYLCSSGARWMSDPARQVKMEEALDFVRFLLDAPIEKIALENPVGIISTQIRKPDQYVHPYQFGDDAAKKTGLWLKNLPLLVPDPADYVEPKLIEYKGKTVKRWGNQSPCGANNLGPSADRWKERSRTYQGIADAMAAQWG